MALQRAVYRPRDAEHTVLYQVVAEHLEAFLGAVAEAGDGAGLPQFVEREFREFLNVRRGRARRGAVSVRGLRPRAPGAVLLQGARVVSEVWRPTDDGAGRTPGGRGAAAGAGAAVGAEGAAGVKPTPRAWTWAALLLV
jgi:hypothetical protein